MRKILIVVIAVFFAALLFAVIFVPVVICKPPATIVKPRFTSTYQGDSLFLVHDTQTGKEYLRGWNGGIIEVEPTKTEK